MLASDQLELAVQFARHVEDRFAEVENERRGKIGVPFIKGSVAWFLGVVDSWYEGGGRNIIAANVRECGSDEERTPLIYVRENLSSAEFA